MEKVFFAEVLKMHQTRIQTKHQHSPQWALARNTNWTNNKKQQNQKKQNKTGFESKKGRKFVIMNLMFRKNFAEKGSTGSERSGFSGGPGLVSNLGPAIGSGSGRMRTGMINSGRGPIRRSREFGYYTMDHEHAPHSYRTHLFFSPHSGTSGLSSEDTIERINANSRRNSSAHNIKWGCNATAQTTSPGPSQNGKIKPIHQRELPPDFSSRKVSLVFNRAIF